MSAPAVPGARSLQEQGVCFELVQGLSEPFLYDRFERSCVLHPLNQTNVRGHGDHLEGKKKRQPKKKEPNKRVIVLGYYSPQNS